MREKLKKGFEHKHGNIAKYIYNYEGSYEDLTTTEIVEQFHVSRSTLSKFIQYLGYDSFYAMKTELQLNERLFKKENNIIYNYFLNPSEKTAFNKLIDDMKNHKKILVVYTDVYINFANELRDRLSKVGYQVESINNTETEEISDLSNTMIISLGNLNENLVTKALSQEIKTSIVGFTNEILFMPQVTYFNYIIFKRDDFRERSHIMLILTLIFIELEA